MSLRHASRVKHIALRPSHRPLPLRPESDGSAELAADPKARARRVAAAISSRAMKRVSFLTPKERS